MISTPYDMHATAICWAAQAVGAKVDYVDSSKFLTNAQSWIEIGHTPRLQLRHTELKDHCRVWFRKGTIIKPVDATPEDAAFVSSEWYDFERGFLSLLEDDTRCTWVNKLSSLKASENKIMQLVEGARVGLKIPKTIMTANYDVARSFMESCSEAVIKPFAPHLWISEKTGTRNFIFARKISIDNFLGYSQRSIVQSPMFYQECIDKVADIRVAVIGDTIFSVKMVYDHSKGIDHREYQNDSDFIYEPYEIDKITETFLRALMKKFDVRVVSADFVLGKDDKLYFIDLNPSGAFLFIEKYVPEYKVLSASVREFVKHQNISTMNVPGWSDFIQTTEFSAALDRSHARSETKAPARGITYV